MNYSKAKLNNPYVSDLQLENIFISEFLPDAPGDFVKVYLYGRMQAETRSAITDKEMAEQLGISEERIFEAWEYWESWGAVRRKYLDEDNKILAGIEFLNLKEQVFDSVSTFEEFDETNFEEDDFDPSGIMQDEEPGPFESEEVKSLMPEMEERLGTSLSLTEMQKVVSWVKDHSIPQDVILYAVDYAVERGKGKFNYIAAVIEGWKDQNLKDLDSVKEHIMAFDDKAKNHKRVLQALGMNRNATEEERRIIDSWFQQGFTMKRVLEACAKTAGITSPNINYVNKVLRNWSEDAAKVGGDINSGRAVTNAQLMEYYAYIKEKAEREAEERKQALYKALPEVEEMDKKLGVLGVKLGKALITKDHAAMNDINRELERLNEDRAICLAENNFEINYTDPRYRCNKCNDTGIAEMGGLCKDCIDERRLEAELWLREKEEGKR